MKRIAKNLLILFFPLFLLSFSEGYFFPRNKFTYRIWESMSVNIFRSVFPGPFYPLRDETLNENTDQDRYGPKTMRNRWVTDIYGQRNERTPKPGEDYGIIIGDSNITGSSLDQSAMLSQELKRQTGYLWVNLMSEYIEPWKHPVCKNHPPKAIVYQLKRGSFIVLNKLGGRSSDPVSCGISLWRTLEPIDHATKFAAINKIRSVLRVPTARFSDQIHDSPHLKMALDFFEYILAKPKKRDVVEIYQKTPVEIITEYAGYCKKNKIDFIVLVLPDAFRKADADIARLQTKKGIKIIGFMPTPDYPNGADLSSFWQKKDSHWAVEGVKKSSSEIVKQLELQE